MHHFRGQLLLPLLISLAPALAHATGDAHQIAPVDPPAEPSLDSAEARGPAGATRPPPLEALRKEKERLELEQALERQRQESALAELEGKRRAITARLEYESAERQRELSRLEADTARLSAERQAIEQSLALLQAKQRLAVSKIKGEVELVEARRHARRHVPVDISYPAQPFQDGVLHISDRRVPLNGPITMAMADEVARRLHFFDNQNPEQPIFVVIDYSPGGSVMAGYRILKAMEAVQAPVHVVVKSLAASMAAVIVTRAEHSYAYPSALVLHHQISGGNSGNVTQQAERLDEAREWSRRLLGPVHEKMGLDHDAFVGQMYEKNSDGNWMEFADEAVKLRWVDHVVREVREAGVVELEEEPPPERKRRRHDAEFDGEDAGPSASLPRLLPGDHWFIYDPDDYYQLAR